MTSRLYLEPVWLICCHDCDRTDTNASTSRTFAENEFYGRGWRRFEGLTLCPDCSGQGPA